MPIITKSKTFARKLNFLEANYPLFYITLIYNMGTSLLYCERGSKKLYFEISFMFHCTMSSSKFIRLGEDDQDDDSASAGYIIRS